MMKADLELVLAWRNHPDVRQHMYTQSEISFKEHSRWFKGACIDPRRHLLIFEVDAVPQGYVNFRFDAVGEAVWGFYLAPGAPKNTGSLLGVSATDYAFGNLGLGRLWGEVLSENLASQNFHLRQGFMLESNLPEKTVGEQMICNVRRYLLTRDAWSARQGATK
jgi:UDP-4-amino-4,6-dideoxy-N-acetyl-beta-L-altrosamine N-acetyltransferase